jgi:hypothetical protein
MRLNAMLFKRLTLIASSALGAVVIVLLVIAELRSWQVQNSPQQKLFAAGKIPISPPEGFYSGYVPGLSGSPWQGKRFDAANRSGVNIFVSDGKASAKYPFHTSVGVSSADRQLQVFKINYNNSANTWWIRLFLDEVVLVKPDLFLGKLSINIVPGRPYQIVFFELKRQNARFRLEPK